MSEGEHVAIARLGLWQAIIAALIAGLCGVLGSYFQLAAQQPATAGEIVETFDRRLPMGTIVASTTGPGVFSELAGDPGNFDPSESVWVPADGRDVAGSAYAKHDPTAKVPDLRGVFLRGLDNGRGMDPEGKGRQVGNLQMDAFKSHTHKIQPPAQQGLRLHHRSFEGSNDGNERPAWSNLPGREQLPHIIKTEAFGVEETRPKNVAVDHYIKIN